MLTYRRCGLVCGQLYLVVMLYFSLFGFAYIRDQFVSEDCEDGDTSDLCVQGPCGTLFSCFWVVFDQGMWPTCAHAQVLPSELMNARTERRFQERWRRWRVSCGFVVALRNGEPTSPCICEIFVHRFLRSNEDAGKKGWATRLTYDHMFNIILLTVLLNIVFVRTGVGASKVSYRASESSHCCWSARC